MFVTPLLDVDNAALGGKLSIFARRRGWHGNLDFQMDAEVERIMRGERGAATAKIFAGSVLLERKPGAVRASNHDREMNRYSTFPSALESWGRSAGCGHPSTSSGYSLGKKAVHSIENFGRSAGRVHVPAQF